MEEVKKLPYTLNEYAVSEPNVICFVEANKGWEKLTATLKTLEDRYNFYVTTDGCGYIYLYLEGNDYLQSGSPHYKWVSAEEDEHLEDVRFADNLTRAKNLIADVDDAC